MRFHTNFTPNVTTVEREKRHFVLLSLSVRGFDGEPLYTMIAHS